MLQQVVDYRLPNRGYFRVVNRITTSIFFAGRGPGCGDGASEAAYSNAGWIGTEPKEARAASAKDLNLYLVSFGVELL